MTTRKEVVCGVWWNILQAVCRENIPTAPKQDGRLDKSVKRTFASKVWVIFTSSSPWSQNTVHITGSFCVGFRKRLCYLCVFTVIKHQTPTSLSWNSTVFNIFASRNDQSVNEFEHFNQSKSSGKLYALCFCRSVFVLTRLTLIIYSCCAVRWNTRSSLSQHQFWSLKLFFFYHHLLQMKKKKKEMIPHILLQLKK